MKDRPILFNTEMMRAVLEGRKTQTRRPITPKTIYDLEIAEQLGECHPLGSEESKRDQYIIDHCPLGRVGDFLWVRETWREYSADECGCYDMCGCPPSGTPVYYVDSLDDESKWKPSIHMPRNASRLLLRIKDVRFEKLESITDQEALIEGFEGCLSGRPGSSHRLSPREHFLTGWRSIYGEFTGNTYVWVLDFEVAILERSRMIGGELVSRSLIDDLPADA